MTLLEAIEARHSVRRYTHRPLSEDILATLHAKINECNSQGDLNIQLVTNETKAFSGLMAYGKFAGVENYLVMAGKKSDTLEERIGYYGEQLVLQAQQLGLNTCWAGLTYRKVSGAYTLQDNDKIVCMIAIGYGMTQGAPHKIKSPSDVSNVSDTTPAWFRQGVEAALLAPTAINQQKFRFDYLHSDTADNRPQVKASRTFSLAGYTRIDLGIAKLHFEIAAGKTNFEWA